MLCYMLFQKYSSWTQILEISDEKLFKEENISLEESIKDFNKIFEKINNLKENIIKEINEADKIYYKTNEKISNYYIIKHEQLLKEENDSKEKLKNEITKVKEQLEIFLSEVNKAIKQNEILKKGINILKNEEKNMIRTLSYISKINKNQKEMNKILQTLIRNLDIYKYN